MEDQLQCAERTSSSTPAMHAERMRSWRPDVLAADVKKAESAISFSIIIIIIIIAIIITIKNSNIKT